MTRSILGVIGRNVSESFSAWVDHSWLRRIQSKTGVRKNARRLPASSTTEHRIDPLLLALHASFAAHRFICERFPYAYTTATCVPVRPCAWHRCVALRMIHAFTCELMHLPLRFMSVCIVCFWLCCFVCSP